MKQRPGLDVLLLYVSYIGGVFFAGLAFTCLCIGNKPNCLLNVMIAGIYFHAALATHDGVTAYPILLPRKYRR